MDQSGNLGCVLHTGHCRFKYSIFLVLLHSYLFSKTDSLAQKAQQPKGSERDNQRRKDQNLVGEDIKSQEKGFHSSHQFGLAVST